MVGGVQPCGRQLLFGWVSAGLLFFSDTSGLKSQDQRRNPPATSQVVHAHEPSSGPCSLDVT